MTTRVPMVAALALALAAGTACKKKEDKAPAAPPAPTISAVIPPSGSDAGGDTVMIYGANFATGAILRIGGTAATGPVVSSGGTLLTATTPAGVGGFANVVVSNPDGQSATRTNGFFYAFAGAGPTVTSVAPPYASPTGGTVLTITGTNFSTTGTTTVYFGKAAGTNVTVTSATTLVVTVPAGALGATTITVVNPSGLSTVATGMLTYVPAPTVTAFTPTSGTYTGGTAVTLTGTNFLPGATVTVAGAAAASVVIVSATQITLVTPNAGQVGQVPIRVTNPDGQFYVRNFPGYVYIGPAPTLTSLNPAAGATTGGTITTLTGTNFFPFATVRFGANYATQVTVVSATTITCRTPSGPATQVNVTVRNTDANSVTLTNGWTYTLAPTVSAVNPAAGPFGGGQTVTVSGTNFSNTPSTPTITFGGTAATGVVFLTSTALRCVTPAHALGPVTVVVTNPDLQTGSLANAYTFSTIPTVTSINPTADLAAGGTPLTITGSSFVVGATASIGGVLIGSITVVNATTITGFTPASTVGIKSVTVTNPGPYSATLAAAFTYRYGPNDQTAVFQWDTSLVNSTNRWYLDFNSYTAFTTDALNKGFQTSTPSDSVNAYAIDWLRAYALRVVCLAYGRNADGTKVSGSSIHVSFVGLPPALGSPGGTGANDYSRECVGGTTCAGGGVVGVSIYDSGTPNCGNSAEDDCRGPQFGGTAGCLGVFSGSLSGSLSPALTQTDLPYLDGTGNPADARYGVIHNAMRGWMRRVGFVAAHEMGHSLGLYGQNSGGSCGGSTLCGATGSHNGCCSGSVIMNPSLGSTSSDTSQAHSGKPGSVAAAASCYTGGTSCWAGLTTWFGLSP